MHFERSGSWWIEGLVLAGERVVQYAAMKTHEGKQEAQWASFVMMSA